MKWFNVKALANEAKAEISVYGEIGGWELPAAEFVKQVQALGQVDQINLSINSPGGSVFDALTMFNYLRRTGAEIVVRIDGIAASAASLLAMAGDKIIMPVNSMMMVHNPWVFAMGNAEELREQADVLDKVGMAIATTYQSRTGQPIEKINELLATDSWLSAQEALAMGFCTEVTDTAVMKALFDVSPLPENVKAVYALAQAQDDSAVETDPAELLGDGLEPEPFETAPEVPLTDLDDDDHYLAKLEEAKAQALAYSQQVVELCALAGMPNKAAGFIGASASLDEVRIQLLTAKASTSQPLNVTQPVQKSWAKMSLTEKSTLIRENPTLAKQLQSLE